uniref:Uncharacterized protein n=1 Tax=Coccidioides posadasii RMSCC 3488 TaxID=454284 RepID=A0A0J6I640_COCPO|nr:hypothetical protein CPAG_03208 [Coccidioides posadasii RMSCC 3488]
MGSNRSEGFIADTEHAGMRAVVAYMCVYIQQRRSSLVVSFVSRDAAAKLYVHTTRWTECGNSTASGERVCRAKFSAQVKQNRQVCQDAQFTNHQSSVNWAVWRRSRVKVKGKAGLRMWSWTQILQLRLKFNSQIENIAPCSTNQKIIFLLCIRGQCIFNGQESSPTKNLRWGHSEGIDGTPPPCLDLHRPSLVVLRPSFLTLG